MRKITLAILLFGMTVAAADAAPSYIKRDNKGGYDVTYNYTDKPKNDWYATLRAEIGFLNFKAEYSTDLVDFSAEDKYSMEPVFAGSLSVGKKFGYHWRGDIELGYTGMFIDEGAGMEMNFSAPYAMVNAMYDFNNGLYLGAGVGAAFPILSMESDAFVPGDRSKTGISPMAALMLGYTHKLDDNFVLDLRYRLAGFNGTTLNRTMEDLDNPGETFNFETKIGLVLDNSFSVGIRYEF